ncbi:hypothetical protein KKF34_18080 [Myxococcota bacterium]|nr:hypothetical protein [Myxococcota bacterium]MBU1498794.1 hypothetical protein [Myxococcota bacterium]
MNNKIIIAGGYGVALIIILTTVLYNGWLSKSRDKAEVRIGFLGVSSCYKDTCRTRTLSRAKKSTRKMASTGLYVGIATIIVLGMAIGTSILSIKKPDLNDKLKKARYSILGMTILYPIIGVAFAMFVNEDFRAKLDMGMNLYLSIIALGIAIGMLFVKIKDESAAGATPDLPPPPPPA